MCMYVCVCVCISEGKGDSWHGEAGRRLLFSADSALPNTSVSPGMRSAIDLAKGEGHIGQALVCICVCCGVCVYVVVHV